jgi:uncharacterized protein (TIGR03437 family)
VSKMLYRAAILLLAGASLFAAEFQNGQAARAVLGQPSFTSREQGITVTSLSVLHGHLYAADAAHQVLTFDFSKLPDVREDFSNGHSNGCSVCEFAPVSMVNQSVMTGVAAVSVWGRMVAIADSAKHRVLIWRDSASSRPDIVLGQSSEASAVGPGTLVNPVSVALDGKRVFVGDAALHRVLVWNSFPTSGDQPADAVLGQPDLTAINASEAPAPDSIAYPAALVSDGANLFVADSANRRILVFSPGDMRLTADAVVNSASLLPGPVAAGTLISVNAAGLSEESDSADAAKSEALPKRLAGTELIFDGQALPLLAVSPTQVQAQIPYDLTNRSAASFYVRTEHANGAVSVTTPISLKLASTSPGLFAFSGSEPRIGILLHAGDSETDGGPPVDKQNPANPGEVLTIWATGLGTVSDNSASASLLAGRPHEGVAAAVSVPVTALINGEDAQVLSATLPEGAIGVYRIQVVVPPEIAARGEAYLSVSQNLTASNTVRFPLRHDIASNHSPR